MCIRDRGTFSQQDIEFNINAINLEKVMRAGILIYKKAYEQTKDYVDKLSIKIGSKMCIRDSFRIDPKPLIFNQTKMKNTYSGINLPF